MPIRNIQATMANLTRYHAKHGNRLIMFSPHTGEEYSANPGDYFMARPDHKFKDSGGRIMQLGTKVPATVRPLWTRKPTRRGRART